MKKSFLTLSDLKKCKSSFAVRFVPSSIPNMGYFDVYFSSGRYCTRNYHINQLIYFVSTNITF